MYYSEVVVRHCNCWDCSLKGRVDELEKLVEEERVKNSIERADAEASLKAALERVQLEATEELKRHNEAAARQQEQQNGIILALQVSSPSWLALQPLRCGF